VEAGENDAKRAGIDRRPSLKFQSVTPMPGGAGSLCYR
jgi:hypothetical protein